MEKRQWYDVDPTNLLISLKNELILLDSDIDIKILDCQVKILLNDEIFILIPFLIMLMIEDVFFDEVVFLQE